MKRKGFTLIELLAVIIVLAIIAVIAAPMVLNTINEAKKGAAMSSAMTYIKEVQKTITESEINDISIADGTYQVGELTDVEVKGNAPTSGQVTITDGQVTEARLYIDGYSIDYDGMATKESNNNYHGTDVILNIGGEELKQDIAPTVEFDITDKNMGTNIVCNNGAQIHIENNKAIVTNSLGNTTCATNASLKDTITNLDTTENYILMLSDETVSEELIIEVGYNVLLNLNEKTLTYDTVDDHMFLVWGNMEIEGTNGSLGGVASSIETKESSNLIINGGTYNRIDIYEKADVKNSIHQCTENKGNCYPIVTHNNSVSTYDNIQVVGSLGKSFGMAAGSSSATIKNSKLECTADNCVWFQSEGSLTLNNVEINAFGYAVKNNSTNGTIEIIDSTITGSANIKPYAAVWNAATGSGTINVKNSNISSDNSAVYLTGTSDMEITDSTITGGANNATSAAAVWGASTGSGTIHIKNSNISSDNTAIHLKGTGDIEITNSTLMGSPDVVDHKAWTTIWNKTAGEGSITIKNSTIGSGNAAIFMDTDANGKIEVTDSTITGAINGSTRSAIVNYSTGDGNITVKNSTVESYNPSVYLTGSGDINIYNSKLHSSNGDSIYINANATTDSYVNIYTSNIDSDNSHGLKNDGLTNMYVYNSNVTAAASAVVNSVTGIININGGEYTVDGAGYQGAISNRSTGTINICAGTINGLSTKYDLYNGSTGYINYSSSVVLKNNKIYDTNDSTHVVVNNSITCQ